MKTFSVRHALICSNIGLIIACHNEIYDKIIHLYRQEFSPNSVHREPLIHLGHRRYEEELHHRGSVPETWGYLSIQELWEIQMEASIDVSFGYADADNWKPEVIDKLFSWWEKIKKDKHGQYCYNQQKYFYPFSLSVDGRMIKETQVVPATLGQIMAAKMDEPISHVKSWVNSRIEILFTGCNPGCSADL